MKRKSKIIKLLETVGGKQKGVEVMLDPVIASKLVKAGKAEYIILKTKENEKTIDITGSRSNDGSRKRTNTRAKPKVHPGK